MGSDATVGYTYQGGTYCPSCILGELDGEAPALDVDAKLDYIATMFGIDREDERSFDSDDFPKVIWADQATPPADDCEHCDADHADYCGRCMLSLIDY